MIIYIQRIFIILSAVFLLSCFNKKKKEFNKAGISDSYNFSITKAKEEDFVKTKSAIKSFPINSDTSLLTYRNETLCFPSDCLDSICLKPAIVEPAPIKKEYTYLGFLKSVNHYVLEKFYEGYSTFLLVEKCMGDRTEIWGYPNISPDSGKVACFASFVTGSTPNGIQIFYLKSDTSGKDIRMNLVKKLEIDQKFWRPLDLAWENRNSLIIKVENFNYEDDQPPSYLRLLLN